MFRRAVIAAVIALLLSLLASSAAGARAGSPPRDPVFGPVDLCLPAIAIAILAEGTVLFICARLRNKPVKPLLTACVIINVLTVTALSLLTGLHIVSSIIGILLLEIAIWLVEARFLAAFPGTRVSWKEGLLFSLLMNLGSLGAGAAALALIG